MSDKDDDHDQGALLEDIDDKLRGIAEVVGGLSDKVDGIDSRLERVEDNVRSIDLRLGQVEKDTELLPTIKDAVTAQSTDLDDHEARLRRLEQQRAA
jgi:archaellum component FlaC